MALAKREMEDAETKRFIEQQKRKKLEQEKEKQEMLLQLARDKEERFGKKFDITGQVKKEPTPLENAKYYIDAIIKLYPSFRCGDQAKLCLSTIKVVLANILKSPTEEKFQKIKMTNPNVQERIAKLPLALKLLTSIHFKEDGEFYALQQVDTTLISEVLQILGTELDKLNK